MHTHHQLIGIESEPVKNEQQQYELLRRHVRHIRNHPVWKQSHIVFIPERGTGLEHSHMGDMVGTFPNLTCFQQKDGVNGVILTGALKRIYQINMVDALFDGSLRVERDFFTISKKGNAPLQPDNMIALLREQMERFHWVHKPANSSTGKDRWSMTGKLGEKQDDALLSLLMAYTWGSSIQTNLRYRALLKNSGGMSRGVVTEISQAVMKSFQTVKNTPMPSLEYKLSAFGNTNTNKRVRGDPNTRTDMTDGMARGATKRIRV